jgi:hypothetical protein
MKTRSADRSGSAWAKRVAVLATLAGVGLAVVTPAQAVASPVQIDLGGVASSGWLAESYSTGGGGTDTLPHGAATFPNWGPTVANPIPAAVWDTSHVGETAYVVPGLTAGTTYQARLYFMDWYFTHSGQREFDVAINGTRVLTNFDIIGTANAKGADGAEAFGVEKDFPVAAAADGTVTIAFTRDGADQPQVNAIALVPGA